MPEYLSPSVPVYVIGYTFFTYVNDAESKDIDVNANRAKR